MPAAGARAQPERWRLWCPLVSLPAVGICIRLLQQMQQQQAAQEAQGASQQLQLDLLQQWAQVRRQRGQHRPAAGQLLVTAMGAVSLSASVACVLPCGSLPAPCV